VRLPGGDGGGGGAEQLRGGLQVDVLPGQPVELRLLQLLGDLVLQEVGAHAVQLLPLLLVVPLAPRQLLLGELVFCPELLQLALAASFQVRELGGFVEECLLEDIVVDGLLEGRAACFEDHNFVFGGLQCALQLLHTGTVLHAESLLVVGMLLGHRLHLGLYLLPHLLPRAFRLPCQLFDLLLQHRMCRSALRGLPATPHQLRPFLFGEFRLHGHLHLHLLHLLLQHRVLRGQLRLGLRLPFFFQGLHLADFGTDPCLDALLCFLLVVGALGAGLRLPVFFQGLQLADFFVDPFLDALPFLSFQVARRGLGDRRTLSHGCLQLYRVLHRHR